MAFFACFEFPFVAGSCWQRLGAIMSSSVLVAALLFLGVFITLEIEKRFVVRWSHASQGYMSSMGVPCEIRWRVGLPSVDATRAK